MRIDRSKLVRLAATVVTALAGISAGALAQPAQQLSFYWTHAGSPSKVGFHFTLHTYDTTGAVPPPLTDYYVRLPLGAAVRREFTTPRYACDGPALRDALNAQLSGIPFTRQIADLRPFMRSLEHSRSHADRVALANAKVCERARVGGGTAQIDGRGITPVLSELIPAHFALFLSHGTVPGAIVGFTILGAADENSPLVRRYPVVAAVHAALQGNVVNDPTPDGLYGLKVLLPKGPINGLQVSIAEVTATIHGLTIAKGTCLKRGAHGRCTSRARTDINSFVVPRCPPSGQLLAQLFAGYAPPTPSVTTTFTVPCPAFTR
jgi:hypothetical protein